MTTNLKYESDRPVVGATRGAWRKYPLRARHELKAIRAAQLENRIYQLHTVKNKSVVLDLFNQMENLARSVE